MIWQRRQFLTLLAGATAVLALKPSVSAQSRKSLLVIELAGGNDGLNTFIPYADPHYRQLRPNLAIPDGIPISSQVALHPALADWQPLFQTGVMALIQNVGYPNPSLSHFRAKEIWQSASTDPSPDTGWLGRYLEASQATTQDGVFLGNEYPLALMGSTTRYLYLAPKLVVKTDNAFGQAMRALYQQPLAEPLAEQVRQTVLENLEAVQTLTRDLEEQADQQGYAPSPTGRSFALASRLIQAGSPVVYLTIGGWDTHVNQPVRQQSLLSQLASGLTTFYRHLQQLGRQQQVLVMVQSEFGRRPAENGARGTDHGTAGVVLLVGEGVKGGFYGGDPHLDSLEKGNLPIVVDFRSLYSEILDRWLTIESKQVIAGSFPALGVLS
ncbi:MAG: DUF1501 domain-containing protein [Cyanobacteriota bacterium]|nr:DUF1501 domain-containing protein [Cyanobacteriota bacterium]